MQILLNLGLVLWVVLSKNENIICRCCKCFHEQTNNAGSNFTNNKFLKQFCYWYPTFHFLIILRMNFIRTFWFLFMFGPRTCINESSQWELTIYLYRRVKTILTWSTVYISLMSLVGKHWCILRILYTIAPSDCRLLRSL